MPTQDLDKALKTRKEISITVTGRKSGKKIRLPIWFVNERGKLLLLPLKGSETNWYRNIVHTPLMEISAGEANTTANVKPTENKAKVSEVVEKFRAKYGAADVKKYYSKFDACVEAILP